LITWRGLCPLGSTRRSVSRRSSGDEHAEHFRREEADLLPLLAAAGHARLVSRPLAAHQLLRQSAAALLNPRHGLPLAFAKSLPAHDGSAVAFAADEAPAAVVKASGSRR
jgi:hypothetical protein